MIVIKTKMKAMPKNCLECSADYTDCPHITSYECMPHKEDGRLDDCPLMEIDDGDANLDEKEKSVDEGHWAS